ncbi:MAG: transposase [Acidobacteriia bacterium]|nr:transposase [Terriglobia bacterium]
MPFFQKRLRLPSSQYRGRRIYFITIGTENRAPFFADPAAGHWLLAHLLKLAPQHDFLLDGYCLMPDHIHFVSEGISDTSDLVRFVNDFKQRTAYEFLKAHNTRLWQRRFYDHILRPDDALEDVACYIWLNPVRKGLCSNPRLYPLSGSQTIDWKTRIPATLSWTPPWKPPLPPL